MQVGKGSDRFGKKKKRKKMLQTNYELVIDLRFLNTLNVLPVNSKSDGNVFQSTVFAYVQYLALNMFEILESDRNRFQCITSLNMYFISFYVILPNVCFISLLSCNCALSCPKTFF